MNGFRARLAAVCADEVAAHLVHGYDSIDDRVVWGVIDENLDSLLEDVAQLLG